MLIITFFSSGSYFRDIFGQNREKIDMIKTTEMEVDFITSKLLVTDKYSLISDNFPIGAVVAYAGDLTNLFNLKKLYLAGWLLCDGKSYKKSEKPDLYNEIGNSFGGNDYTFSVPDLRNRFLKGKCAKNGNSIDSKDNSTTSKSKSPSIGSLSCYSKHNGKSIDRLTSIIDSNCIRGAINQNVEEDSDILTNIFSGSDTSKSVANVSLYFIIKANLHQTSGRTPAGAIIAHGGETSEAMPGWLKCDGSFYYNMAYYELYKTISSNYGNAGRNFFNVPDLRGAYLKGKSHYTPFDGFNQDLMGEMQENTVSSNFDNSVLLPPGPYAPAPGGYSNNEKREKNAVCADFFIANTKLVHSAPPIGSVMCYGGDYSNPMIRKSLSEEGWLPCDGSYLLIEKYHELYNVIGTVYGGGNLTFNLPDLRGVSVIGAGYLPVGKKLYASSSIKQEEQSFETEKNSEESDNVSVPKGAGVDYIIRVR
jgi:microcystin-dependent protein